MKLHLSHTLLALLAAVSASADTVLNQVAYEYYYGTARYTIHDNHLILDGDWLPVSALGGMLEWSSSGTGVFDGSGVCSFVPSVISPYVFNVTGNTDARIASGITLKNCTLGLNAKDRNSHVTCYFENAFSGNTVCSLTDSLTTADFSSVRSFGTFFEVNMRQGTLRTKNGFTLNSKVTLEVFADKTQTAKVVGGLIFANGGKLSVDTHNAAPLMVSGGVKVAGSGSLCITGYDAAMDKKLDSMEEGEVIHVEPRDGWVVMHTDTYSGKLSSLKLKAQTFKVTHYTYTDGTVYKVPEEIDSMTLRDWYLSAEPTVDGGYDLVMRMKSSAPPPFVFPTTVTAKQTIKIPETQLPTGTATTILVQSSEAVTYTVASKGQIGIGGTYRVEKRGSGTLTLNPENSYTGGTLLVEGMLRGSGDHSFGTGTITIEGGTLDLASKAVTNAVNLNGKAVVKGGTKYQGTLTIKGELLPGSALALGQDATLSGCTVSGTLSGVAGVSVSGNVRVQAKQKYQGTTTVNSGAVLTLADKASLSGNILIKGGTLRYEGTNGLKLVKNQTLTLSGGSVTGNSGLLIGAGSTFTWGSGTLSAAPLLCGGVLDLGGSRILQVQGKNAAVSLGSKTVQLGGKGSIRTNDTLTIKEGVVTVSSLEGYTAAINVQNGSTLKLSTGKTATQNAITVAGVSSVINGSTHSGDITVTGTLGTGTNIRLSAPTQRVLLKGSGTMSGSISGSGIVDVNANIDATAAKITAAHLNLNSYTLTNTKGMKLVKGQTLKFGGGKLHLGGTGTLTTCAGSTLQVSVNGTVTGNLTLGGGDIVFTPGRVLTVSGTLTLSKAMNVTGSGSIVYGSLKTPATYDLEKMFDGRATLNENKKTLSFTAAAPRTTAAAPLDTLADVLSPPVEEALPAPLDTAALSPLMAVLAPLPTPAPEPNPVADALVQADWGILDAERAFLGAVKDRHQHAALLDKGRGAAWVSAFGASVRHGSKGGHHGSDGNLCGAAFGLEHAVSETGTVGLAVGRSTNRIAATGVTHLRQETAHVALYGQKHLAHGFTADAAAAWGDTETKLSGSTLSQKSAALTARLTQAQQLNDATSFRTFGGLSYEATDSGSLGATHTGSVQNLRAELGAGATHSVGKAHLYAEAALTGDLIRHNPTAALDGIRTHGANPGRLGIRATVGALYEFTDTWSGTASYSVETEARSTSHTLNIGVSKQF